MSVDKAVLFLHYWNLLSRPHPIPAAEYPFHPTRRWRFDFAWPDRKIAVEIEGNAWSVKGGGKHMQDSDLEKYNEAASLGWRVFRFSPGMLNRDPVSCIGLIQKALA